MRTTHVLSFATSYAYTLERVLLQAPMQPSNNRFDVPRTALTCVQRSRVGMCKVDDVAGQRRDAFFTAQILIKRLVHADRFVAGAAAERHQENAEE